MKPVLVLLQELGLPLPLEPHTSKLSLLRCQLLLKHLLLLKGPKAGLVRCHFLAQALLLNADLLQTLLRSDWRARNVQAKSGELLHLLLLSGLLLRSG